MFTRTLLAPVIFGLVLAAAAAPPTSVKAGKPDAPAKQVTLLGVVEYDESKLVHVSSRAGRTRIDKLHVTLVGERVKRGEPLADLYNPDLVVTTQDLFGARNAGNKDLEAIARDRLKLWGFDDKQVDEIVAAGKPITHLTIHSPITGHVLKKHVREGEYVEEGARLFDVADLSTVWVEARVVDQSDMAVIKRGLPVRVTAKAVPDRRFDGEVLVAAYRDPDSRELRVRFTVTNPRQELRPGMHATVVLRAAPNADTAELAKTKVVTAKVAFEATAKAFGEGKADAEKVYLWSRRWMEAQCDAGDKQADRAAAVEAHRDRMKELRKVAEARYKIAQVSHGVILGADFYIAEAELWLAEVKAK